MQRATTNLSVPGLAAAASVTLALTLSMAGLVKHYSTNGSPQANAALAAATQAGTAKEVAIVPMRIEVVASRTHEQSLAANPGHAQSI